MTRRVFVGAAAARVAATATRPVAMIHATDLFRPHDDPDDHWDLACVYALAQQGAVDLCGILIDYPKPERKSDPDVQAVAQLNHLTGRAVPVMVGAPRRIEAQEAGRAENRAAVAGIRAMLGILRASPAPVVINILGSCRDVAIAGKMEPGLFARKCRAVYLNAGSGTRDETKAARLEWNVSLDPASYADIFSLPCPVYWLPCFEEVRQGDLFRVAEWGSFYRFRHGEVLAHLSEGMQRYFAYVFERGGRSDWLRYLGAAAETELRARVAAMDRNMWCTGGFLHAAGRTVTVEGEIVPLGATEAPVFTFDPVEVSCDASGVTRWRPDGGSRRRFIFHVRDRERYAAAMTSALRTLLKGLP